MGHGELGLQLEGATEGLPPPGPGCLPGPRCTCRSGGGPARAAPRPARRWILLDAAAGRGRAPPASARSPRRDVVAAQVELVGRERSTERAARWSRFPRGRSGRLERTRRSGVRARPAGGRRRPRPPPLCGRRAACPRAPPRAGRWPAAAAPSEAGVPRSTRSTSASAARRFRSGCSGGEARRGALERTTSERRAPESEVSRSRRRGRGSGIRCRGRGAACERAGPRGGSGCGRGPRASPSVERDRAQVVPHGLGGGRPVRRFLRQGPADDPVHWPPPRASR